MSLTYNVSRHVQKIIPGLVSEWQDHDSIEWLQGHRVQVTGLRPYTTYKVCVCVFKIIIQITK